MDVMTAVLTRRSDQLLVGPAPSDHEFAYLLRGAAASPDHGDTRQWRWILTRGEDCVTLARCFAEEHGGPDSQREDADSRLRDVPLIATLVLSSSLTEARRTNPDRDSPDRRDPDRDSPVPGWERLAGVGAMVNSLMLLLHARGFGSTWHTGGFTESGRTGRLLSLDPEERPLGRLYIGTPQAIEPPRRRTPADISDRISVFPPNPSGAPGPVGAPDSPSGAPGPADSSPGLPAVSWPAAS
ncbi:nitroreductase family protein [Streptomyces sp. NPDC001770]